MGGNNMSALDYVVRPLWALLPKTKHAKENP